jgi:hypothetical protein
MSRRIWKPGQCVTICGNKYRIVKKKQEFVNCKLCSLLLSGMCYELCEKSHAKVPSDCYFVEIKPKS